MSTTSILLDTPKRITLQSQSTEIRAALKDFERTFAAENAGRKPSKDDIKADVVVAAKYKEYNRVRDVLSGKLDYATFVAPPKSPPKRRRHERNESDANWTPRKRSYDTTPRKPSHSGRLDSYDVICSTSPKPVLYAIGPTPQRDGKVLGLFDLLSNSAHSSRATPSNRKRKLDVLIEEAEDKLEHETVAQTPSQRKVRGGGDLLDYLAGTPETGHRKHSRTPISEGRKFMLNQFFATPSAARFSTIDSNCSKERTPLRNRVLGETPDTKIHAEQAPDATPSYLRRSTSFKDRLLSASQATSKLETGLFSPPATRTGPPTLRHLRSVSRMFTEAEPVFPEIQEEDEDADDGHDDDLEALRELEDDELDVPGKDAQQRNFDQADNSDGPTNQNQPLQKAWKKRGQKRTTRRAVMRPTQGKSAQAPKFVAAANDSDQEQYMSQDDKTHVGATKGCFADGEDQSDNEEFAGSGSDDSEFEASLSKKSKSTTKAKAVSANDKSKKTGTINPNAVSHMNFRTLKIKNKNSKAKGRGRFGRGRR